MCPQTGRLVAVLTLCLALWPAAAVQAREVLRVDGAHATLTDDPLAPPQAGSDIGREPRTGARTGTPRATSAKRRRLPRGRRAVRSALLRALRSRGISRRRRAGFERIYALARTRHRRLRGARRRELGSVIATIEAIALRRQLSASRMPALFLILRRNAEFWPRSPFPANRGLVSFAGSELLFEYYSGHGLQLQPLVNFKHANAMHGACVKRTGPCEPAALRRLLGELIGTSARRGGFRTWEYYFEFGGGRPPWISGMAQATAIQALGRASQLLEQPGLRRYASESFAAFETPPPIGVATAGPLGGTHYLQYSFAPRLFIINAFLQAVIGLYDYAEIAGDASARRLYAKAEPEARREVPANDTGDWSTYSYAGAESSREYHELLREFVAGLCGRLRHDAYCDAARRFRLYATEPAELALIGPETAVAGQQTRVRFSLSKLSAVQITISRDGRTVLDQVDRLRRGTGSFAWKPRGAGVYRVQLAAKELRTGRELRTRTSGEIESKPAG